MSGLTKQQIRKYKIDRAKLIKGSKHSMYIHEDILIPIIMQSRLLDPKTMKFRSDLGFNQINLILKKEQSVVIPLLKAFSAEKIELQCKILEHQRVRTDMYFSEHKRVVEIDAKGHTDRKQKEENERQIKIEKHPGYRFFRRINPDAEVFDIFFEISKIQGYIARSNKEKLKELENIITDEEDKIKEQENEMKEQMSKFAKELLSYMSSISMPLKHIRCFVIKTLPIL